MAPCAWPPLIAEKQHLPPTHICYFSNSQCLRNNQVRPMAGSKDLYSRLLPACYFFSPHSFQESQNACYLNSSTKEEFRLLSLRSHWRAGAATCRQWLCKELFCSSITDDTHVWFPGKPRYLMTPPWCCAPAKQFCSLGESARSVNCRRQKPFHSMGGSCSTWLWRLHTQN